MWILIDMLLWESLYVELSIKKNEELYERTVLNVLNDVNEYFRWCHIRHLLGYFNDSHIITENGTKT